MPSQAAISLQTACSNAAIQTGAHVIKNSCFSMVQQETNTCLMMTIGKRKIVFLFFSLFEKKKKMLSHNKINNVGMAPRQLLGISQVLSAQQRRCYHEPKAPVRSLNMSIGSLSEAVESGLESGYGQVGSEVAFIFPFFGILVTHRAKTNNNNNKKKTCYILI